MIGRVGIVDRAGLDGKQRAAAVAQAYARYRALRAQWKAQAGDGAGPEWEAAIRGGRLESRDPT
jgi:hypothetical protein